MTAAGLVDMVVMLVVSDPWDWVTVHGAGPFVAQVLQVGVDHWNSGKGAALLQLKIPLTYRGIACEYFIASTRHKGEDLASLAEGSEAFCSLTQISEDRATSRNPFDLSWWRGGIGLIGTLRKLSPPL